MDFSANKQDTYEKRIASLPDQPNMQPNELKAYREVYSDKEIKEPEKGFQKIWLTHDVDAPFFCKSIRNLIRETIKGCGLKNAWRMYRDKYENDPYFTFPWFTEQEKELKKKKGELCQTIYFIKGGGTSSNLPKLLD